MRAGKRVRRLRVNPSFRTLYGESVAEYLNALVRTAVRGHGREEMQRGYFAYLSGESYKVNFQELGLAGKITPDNWYRFGIEWEKQMNETIRTTNAEKMRRRSSSP